MILPRSGRGEPCQRVAVIPGHPFRRLLSQLVGVALQFDQVLERVGSVQFARMDQTHKQIAYSGAIQCPVE